MPDTAWGTEYYCGKQAKCRWQPSTQRASKQASNLDIMPKRTLTAQRRSPQRQAIKCVSTCLRRGGARPSARGKRVPVCGREGALLLSQNKKIKKTKEKFHAVIHPHARPRLPSIHPTPVPAGWAFTLPLPPSTIHGYLTHLPGEALRRGPVDSCSSPFRPPRPHVQSGLSPVRPKAPPSSRVFGTSQAGGA